MNTKTEQNNTDSLWAVDELSMIWKNQLNAPLGHDLSETFPDAEETIIRLRKAIRKDPVTFGGLFRHPNPPYELLHLVKEFAKKQGTNTDSVMPKDISTALYYMSIHLAHKHHKQRISDLDDATILQGMNWLKQQAWLDDETRDLI